MMDYLSVLLEKKIFFLFVVKPYNLLNIKHIHSVSDSFVYFIEHMFEFSVHFGKIYSSYLQKCLYLSRMHLLWKTTLK
jgi:hypothetical protein